MKTDKEIKLLSLVGELLEMIDPDGNCEHGCACGECNSCMELELIKSDYYRILEEDKEKGNDN